MAKCFLSFCFLFVLFGCQVHQVCEVPEPPVEFPVSFSHEPIFSSQATSPWWKNLEDPVLNALIETALANNLRLDEAWQRLEQARAHTSISESALLPEISLSVGYRYQHSLDRCFDNCRHHTQFVNVGPSLSYQVDLWGRIRNQVASQTFFQAATCEDYFATALTITGEVANFWLNLQELHALEELLENQISLSKNQLDLVEYRFSLGQATALQVYQQKQQLQRTQLQLPNIKASIETALHRLNTLLGVHPTTPIDYLSTQGLPSLPPLETLGTPCDLLKNRPDLKSAMHRLVASDYEVGVALADRFPRFDLALNYGFSGCNLGHIFDQEAGSVIANILTPLFDYGRRKNQVIARRAAVRQAVDQFGSIFLSALNEVEDALSREKYQLEFIEGLAKQLQISEINLTEAQTLYESGISDYLDVIVAIQAIESVQRELISAQKTLLSNRIQLYLALGGPLLCAFQEEEVSR